MLKGNKILYLIFFVLLIVTIGEVAYYFFFKPAPSQQVQTQEPQQIIAEPTTSQVQTGTQTTAVSIPPKEFLNDSKSYSRQPFDNKIIDVKGNFRVGVDLKIEIQKKTPVGHSNGLVISNNESDEDLRELILNYQYGGWNLGYYVGGKQEFFERLLDDKNLELAGKFFLKIDKEGKKVAVTLPNNQEKSFDLKETFYPLEKKVVLKIQVAPLSKVIVSHLKYQQF